MTFVSLFIARHELGKAVPNKIRIRNAQAKPYLQFVRESRRELLRHLIMRFTQVICEVIHTEYIFIVYSLFIWLNLIEDKN